MKHYYDIKRKEELYNLTDEELLQIDTEINNDRGNFNSPEIEKEFIYIFTAKNLI